MHQQQGIAVGGASRGGSVGNGPLTVGIGANQQHVQGLARLFGEGLGAGSTVFFGGVVLQGPDQAQGTQASDDPRAGGQEANRGPLASTALRAIPSGGHGRAALKDAPL